MPEKCYAIGCDHPVVANSLCATHYKRQKRHGHIEDTRPKDWGSKEKHPLYLVWYGLKRYHKANTDPQWIADFWTFVSEVPEREGKAQACRPDPAKPWAKDNFYWKVSRVSADLKLSRAEYVRQWYKVTKGANKDYQTSVALKKNYGLTLDKYNAILASQNGVCAICSQPEKVKIKGQLIRLAVDHWHDTGRVRGLLCAACNRAIGGLQHDQTLLRAAIEYLQK
jgi:hypothetical protein